MKKSVECYDTCTKINPGYANAWGNKGYVLGKLGRYKQAHPMLFQIFRNKLQ